MTIGRLLCGCAVPCMGGDFRLDVLLGGSGLCCCGGGGAGRSRHLRAAARPQDLLLAALPLLLALHQLTEGVVWLGLQGDAPGGLRDAATRAYLGFAQVVLPVIVPLGILLTEPDRRRRAWMGALLVGGAVVAARFAWILTSNPVGAQALDHVIIYDTDWVFGYVTAGGYVLVTCGPALIASSRLLRWFGVASLAGLLLASGVRYSAVTSIWCVVAALVSVLVLLHFRDRAQRAPASPPSRSRQPQG